MSKPSIIEFTPVAVSRPWGGRRLAEAFGKTLPVDTPIGERGPQPIGEMWEISDRPEVQSVVRSGPLAGQTLHNLWQHQRAEIFGEAYVSHPSTRFPLLIKLLDARERLSLQVHPPAETAERLGGEPKTEAWYFIECDKSGAAVFAGVKPNTTRETFKQALRDGTVESLLNAVPVKKFDALFVPSGRLHAIDAGSVIIEVQQNSDTTYRVFDWNRRAPDGTSRQLHIEESLASIDFSDTTPTKNEGVVCCPYFEISPWRVDAAPPPPRDLTRFAIYAIADGTVTRDEQTFSAASFFLTPAGVPANLHAVSGAATALQITLP